MVPLYLQNNPLHSNDWEEEKPSASKFHFRRFGVVEEVEYESIENLLIGDLDEVFSNFTMLNLYTRSMMVTLKLVLQSGYGAETSDSIHNMMMSTFLMFCGWIYTAYVLVLVSNVIIAAESSENKFEEMSKEIEAFCTAKRLSAKLTKKIQTFYKYKFQTHYYNEDAIRDSTPPSLQKEIMMLSCSSLIAKVPLFKEIPQLLLEKIVSCLKMEIYFPDDVIIKVDTIGDSMFFISFGSAAIYSASGKAQILNQTVVIKFTQQENF